MGLVLRVLCHDGDMWQPPGAWEPVRRVGPGTAGLWRVPGCPGVVVKRLVRPLTHEEAVSDPGALAWWRREADVALSGASSACEAFVGPEVLDVQEDGEGVSIFFAEVGPGPVEAGEVARAAGALAVCEHPVVPSAVRDQFGQRLAAVERRGGWAGLVGSPVEGIAAAVWNNRDAFRRVLARAPQGPAHGDLTRANVLRSSVRGVVAVDWDMYGRAPVGSDLGHWALAVGRDAGELVADFLAGLAGAKGQVPGVRTDAVEVLAVARTVALFTALARADWAAERSGAAGQLPDLWEQPGLAQHLRAVQQAERALEVLAGGTSSPSHG